MENGKEFKNAYEGYSAETFYGLICAPPAWGYIIRKRKLWTEESVEIKKELKEIQPETSTLGGVN